MKVFRKESSYLRIFSTCALASRFGNVRQKIFDMTSFDTSSVSNGTGTEVSGFLGFTTLRFLDIKIDYRDGLVDFKYDPSHWEH